MHLAYLEQNAGPVSRRNILRGGALGVGSLVAAGIAIPASAARTGDALGHDRNLTTGQIWIDAFYHKGAQATADLYADDFVFEDAILFQMINTKDDLLRAFEPFDNLGPDSPLGIHRFDIIRYNGGRRADQTNQFRSEAPAGYDPQLWQRTTADARAGDHLDFDEWAIMHWLWQVQHASDFLGMPAQGKTTQIRGVTHHLYREGKITQEHSYWNYRDLAIQLGVLPPPTNRHELSSPA